MLKNIPKNISPDLLKILCEMGHGDEIEIEEGNLPAASHTKRLVRCDSTNVSEILKSILEIFPLDEYVENPVFLMKTGEEYEGEPEVWGEYRSLLGKCEEFKDFELLERFSFYDRAKNAYAVVSTSEEAIYANIILKKGVVK